MAAKKKAPVKRKAPVKKKAVRKNPARKSNQPEHIVIIKMPGNRVAYFSGYEFKSGRYQVTFDDEINKAKRYDLNAAKSVRCGVINTLAGFVTGTAYKEIVNAVHVAKK